MSWLLKIIALLSQLQNNALVLEIEACVVSNTTVSAIWTCILAKLTAHTKPTPHDAALIGAAKALAANDVQMK